MQRQTLNFALHDPPLERDCENTLIGGHCDRWMAGLIAGPANFAVLEAALQMGVIQACKDNPVGVSSAEIASIAGITEASNLHHFLNCCISIGLLDMKDSLYHLAFPMNDSYFKKLEGVVKFNYWIVYRQLWYFRASLVSSQPKGVKELYGEHHKNLYTACETEPDLHAHWTPLMDYVTDQVEDQMLAMMTYAQGSRILDCAGQTGLGAVRLLRAYPEHQLKVTVLDQEWKRQKAEEYFRLEKLEGSADFMGGDVFKEIPRGFDVIQFKHFINMFSEEEIRKLIKSSYDALSEGGRLLTFTLHAPEELKGNLFVPWCTTYFIATAMGRGGPWKASDVSKWMLEEGFGKVEQIEVFPPHTVVMGLK